MSPQSTSRSTITRPFSRLTPPAAGWPDAVTAYPAFRDGGQAQYIERPTPEPTAATTAPARAWAMDHLSECITLSHLASEANMSVRTFTRRVREEMGTTPGAWLTQQRLDLARWLLETCDSSIEDVARTAGLGTGSGLRQHFQHTVGIALSCLPTNVPCLSC